MYDIWQWYILYISLDQKCAYCKQHRNNYWRRTYSIIESYINQYNSIKFRPSILWVRACRKSSRGTEECKLVTTGADPLKAVSFSTIWVWSFVILRMEFSTWCIFCVPKLNMHFLPYLYITNLSFFTFKLITFFQLKCLLTHL